MRGYELSGVVVSILMTLSLVLTGCGGNTSGSSSSGGSPANEAKTEASQPGYIDDQAVSIIAKGYEARVAWMKDPSFTWSTVDLRKAVNLEIENDKVLRNASFKDANLQKACLAYLDNLDKKIKALDEHPVEMDGFVDAWNEVYDESTIILGTLVNDFGMTVSDKYADHLKDAVSFGAAIKGQDAAKKAIGDVVASANWEKTNINLSYYRYTAVIENTTDYTFGDIDLLLSLYDAEDVKTEAHANMVSSWAPGEKIRFECVTDKVDAQRVVAAVNRFTTR